MFPLFCMYEDKDRHISSLREELQARQEKITSFSEMLEEREQVMLEQKGKKNEST